VSAQPAADASLTIVGTGIDAGGQFTPQGRAFFTAADEAFYLVADPVAVRLLEWLNPAAHSLHRHYGDGKDRLETYEGMAEEILAPLRRGRDVCAAFYGHPGIYVYPARVAVERARAEGFSAKMLPGVSSLDCLFADLDLDPALTGCQIHHATELFVRRIEPDTASLLILFQIGAIGQPAHHDRPDWSNLPLLVEYLTEFYPAAHEVTAYAASPYPLTRPVVKRAPLEALVEIELTVGMTLVVPPASEREVDATMLARLEQHLR